jgi:hypothetical protein
VVEAAQLEGRDGVLEEFGAGVAISDREVKRWLKKLGV